MSKYWSSIVRELDPYVPGEQPKVDNLIKLNTNESPYGPSPDALEAMRNHATDSLRLYPDPNSDLLKEAVADFYRIDTAKVFVGNGSDEVLAHTFQALLKQDKPLLFPDISYSFYPVYCSLYRIAYEAVPLDDELAVNIEDYKRENGGILFANPNAPTGRLLSINAIENLLKVNRDSVMVLDEAYIDFGGQSGVPLTESYDNLLIVQTLSKSRALAGLRVGFAIGHENLIEALERVKNSFNSYPLDRFAIHGAAASMRDRAYFEITCKKIIESRERLAAGLRERGFQVVPSAANFVFARNKIMDAEQLSARLRQKNILVRHFKKPRIDQYLRITVGDDEQCSSLLQALDEILNG